MKFIDDIYLGLVVELVKSQTFMSSFQTLTLTNWGFCLILLSIGSVILSKFSQELKLLFDVQIWWVLLRRSFRNTLRGMELIRHSCELMMIIITYFNYCYY